MGHRLLRCKNRAGVGLKHGWTSDLRSGGQEVRWSCLFALQAVNSVRFDPYPYPTDKAKQTKATLGSADWLNKCRALKNCLCSS